MRYALMVSIDASHDASRTGVFQRNPILGAELTLHRLALRRSQQSSVPTFDIDGTVITGFRPRVIPRTVRSAAENRVLKEYNR